MPIARMSLAVAAALLIAGCWGGAPWYEAADAVAVLPDGRYRLAEAGSASPEGASPEGDRITVHNRADGTMLFTGAEHPWQGIAARIDPRHPDRFVLQLRQGDDAATAFQPKAMYVLLTIEGEARFVTILPCGGTVAQAVERAGGFVSRDPQSAASCGFPDKATLEAQLQAILRDPPRPDIELRRDEG